MSEKILETKLGTKFVIRTHTVGQSFGVVSTVYIQKPEGPLRIGETPVFPLGCEERALECAEDLIRREYGSHFS